MRRPMIAGGLLVLATAAWTVAIAVRPPDIPDVGVILVGASLWTATVTALAGVLIARSRWARRLALVTCGAHAILAAMRVVDPWWAAGVVGTVAAAIAIAGPWFDPHVRRLPPATAPPSRAVLIPLILIATPFLVGIGGGEPWPAAALGLAALAAAFVFVRALPGALVVVRVLFPALALTLAYPMGGWIAGVSSVLAGVSVGALAWHSSVTVSVRPLTSKGSIVAVPPELAPREILDAARIDERGRPR